MIREEDLFIQIKVLIQGLRRKREPEKNWIIFKEKINSNIEEICKTFDTRWLVSIADTYVDYGNEIEKRNALYISLIANFEKFWATNLLMYDVRYNKQKAERLKQGKIIPLWDGMYSFNINKGDMSNNLFTRLNILIAETPVLEKIYYSVISRLNENNSALGNLNKYHRDLYGRPRKRSLLKSIFKKLRLFVNQYKLPFF